MSNGLKQSTEEKINNEDEEDLNVYINKFLTDSKQDEQVSPTRIQETKIDEILNNLNYSKHNKSTNSIENNQLVNNSPFMPFSKNKKPDQPNRKENDNEEDGDRDWKRKV